jgi:hypothetical protein
MLKSLTSSAGNRITPAGGTFNAFINLGSNSIINLPDPSSGQDAATNKYIDIIFIGWSDANVVPVVTCNTTLGPYVLSASSEYETKLAYGAFT